MHGFGKLAVELDHISSVMKSVPFCNIPNPFSHVRAYSIRWAARMLSFTAGDIGPWKMVCAAL